MHTFGHGRLSTNRLVDLALHEYNTLTNIAQLRAHFASHLATLQLTSIVPHLSQTTQSINQSMYMTITSTNIVQHCTQIANIKTRFDQRPFRAKSATSHNFEVTNICTLLYQSANPSSIVHNFRATLECNSFGRSQSPFARITITINQQTYQSGRQNGPLRDANCAQLDLKYA